MLFKQPRLINPLKYLIWTISTGDSSASPLAISIAAGFVTLSIEVVCFAYLSRLLTIAIDPLPCRLLMAE